ncbi:MAG: hypothetical protein LV480_04885 [Methylacidiphilales bacterium]|nr:hypothetical protein [Candidatus Methylacidiphilales bacterium]
MSWAKLLGRYVTAEPTSKAELDNLRSIVTRSLQDAVAAGLSTDARFVMAYDAARTLSLILVRSEGYRPKSGGGHYNTFLALHEADPIFATLSTYFDGCRMKRNGCEYDFAGGVSDTDADGLLKAVQKFKLDVEAWMTAHHPNLI